MSSPRASRLPAMLRSVRLDRPTSTSMSVRGMLGVIGVAAQGAVRFLTSFVVGRVGGPAVLGVVQSAISTATLFSLLWPTTTGSAASKFVARARGSRDSVQASSVAAHLARRTLQTSTLLAIAAATLWMVIDHGTPVDAGCVAVLVVALSGYSFTRGVQFGAGQIRRATAWDVISGSLGVCGVAVAAFVGVRGTPLVLPFASAYLLYTVAGWPWGAAGRPTAALRREMDVFVLLGVMGTLASAGFIQLSMIAARLVANDAQAGQYAAALTLATPASLLATSLSLVLFPSMAEALGRGDVAHVRRQTDQATRALVLVMISVFGAIALCSRLIVFVIWGARFAEAATLLPVLLFAVLATTLGVASVNSLTSRSQQGMVITTSASLTGLVGGGIMWTVLGQGWGVMGIAVGYLGGAVIIAGVPIATVWRRDGHAWAPLASRAALGLGVLVMLILGQRQLPTARWTDPIIALVFTGLWLILMRRDALMLYRRGRASRR